MPDSNWINRIIGHGEENPLKISAHPKNWRAHPDHQRDVLKGALTELGWLDEVIVNASTGFLVNGHLRVALAIEAKQPTVPVKYVSLDAREEALALASFDTIGALAQLRGDTFLDLTRNLTVENAAVLDLLDTLRQQADDQLRSLLPSAEGDGRDGGSGGEVKPEKPPQIKLKVPPETYALYRSLIDILGGDDEAASFDLLLSCVNLATE